MMDRSYRDETYYKVFTEMYNMIEYQARMMLLDDEVPPLAEEVPPCQRMKIILDMPALSKDAVDAKGWNEDDKSPNMTIYSEKLLCARNTNDETTDCIRSLVGFTNGLHCWEIRWPQKQRTPFPIIGVATKEAPLHIEGRAPVVGANPHSWGIDIDTNTAYHNGESWRYPVLRDPDDEFTFPESIMLLLDMDEGTLSYVANNKNLGVAFTGLNNKTIYPIINMANYYGVGVIRYVGSLPKGPPSLKLLARAAIRNAIGFMNIVEDSKELNLPENLETYVSRPGLTYP
ncbi:hypothetical protein GWI33_012109 [Rhynchophorus ferrugineus]|uniref:B30.2/SPRY domain-containing protein n=1 Tax=Rhynchophorus ferrugineus TaxID=354439 RepID=A0A834IAR5_RHYFE|nr:hypothetical protein GWI33_012109 [Rhynchophorus ferrugineus]